MAYRPPRGSLDFNVFYKRIRGGILSASFFGFEQFEIFGFGLPTDFNRRTGDILKIGSLPMKYIVHSKFLIDLTPTSSWLTSRAYVFRMCRRAAYVISAIAYFGVLVSPGVILTIPFQALHAGRLQPPSILYWFSAVTVLLFALWLLYRVGSAGYHGFRSGVISLEAVFGFIGIVFSIAFIVWFLPSGWPAFDSTR